ncbi:MAG: hypothetical protein AB1403_20785 [Candidatus Riflebacteria bacterium]
MKKWPATCVLTLLMAARLLAVSYCPGCNFRLSESAFQCPKCLRMVEWPYTPARSEKARVIVRTGKDAFIRHPRSQNRAWKSAANAGGDLAGQIGSWGFVTGLRYLICFDIPRSFAEAGLNLSEFKLRQAKLRLVIADQKINQQIPVRVYPLTRPFLEGKSRFHIRRRKADGCNWEFSAPLLSWHVPGGDYLESLSAPGILGLNSKHEVFIDVTEIFAMRFAELKTTGVWNDPGLIIMRDHQIPCSCTFLSIFSLETNPRGQQVNSPQLFLY